MKIGIICASENELAPFLDEFQEDSVVEKAMLKIHIGEIGAHDVVLLYCGVCKVNAAIAAQIVIDEFNVDAIINAGVAGGMDSRLRIFDTVVSTEVAYHDVASEILTEYHPRMKSVFFAADDNLLKIAKDAAERIQTKGKIYFGRMVTGEAFISDDGRQEIIDAFNPLSVDMETGSIAHVCYANSVPFLAIRSITDTADHGGSGFFEMNCKEASRIAKDFTVEVIRSVQLEESANESDC
ncbi:MAG: 5'-methylthioadenosine/adenosylhomocysteine nucleosidase [Lachnospiraceae bacterium]|nr:5'-methylthioadenosine/adenosylhomocysteine nucleosidase [Lachnospiraceae bacterium]